MCTCNHGSDRHYLDYAGPGFCGGVLGRCLEKDCKCVTFTIQTVTLHYPQVIYHPAIWTPFF